MILRIQVFLVAVFLALISTVCGFEFANANQEENGVTFGEVENGAQQVYVDENNNGTRVTAVLLTGVQGTPSAVIYNGEKLLDLKFKNNGSNQYGIEINTLDYESLNGVTSFFMDIYDSGSSDGEKSLNIWINNLDDEPPTFSTSACTMKEHTNITVDNSECIFTIQDPDGFLSKMDFSGIVNSPNNYESEIFLFTYKDIPEDKVLESDVYLILQEGQVLDYQKMILYTFHIKVKDGAGHATVPVESVPVIVQVEDIPDLPPIWQSFTSIIRIDEESPASLTISAKDGDFGINNPINYDLGDNPTEITKKFISIGRTTGIINIESIDRDIGPEYQRIEFEVRAYEVGDEESQLVDTIIIIVDDIDDNSPLLSVEGQEEKELKFAIEENYSDELDYVIIVNDIDEGENAMYTVELQSSNALDYSTTFQIIPGRGYERTQLSLVIISAKNLDYEDPDWRILQFDVVSIGTKNTSHTDRLPVEISLIDVNDEFPQFDKESYEASVYENVTIDTVIACIKATDADAEDAGGVNHTLVGTMVNNILSIEHLGGDITTIVDNAFDYEKQTEVLVQIRATDAVGHINSTQLTIQVIDLVDEPPRMAVSSAIQVDENQPDGQYLSTSITATDDDQMANLIFSIDWENSYATKNSAPLVKPEDIEKTRCIEVETIEEGSNQKVSARLRIKETVKDNTPDYEIFDTLFIKLIVTDLNTEINEPSDSALIVINIGNLNDNPPEFLPNTASTKRYVTDGAKDGALVGQVTATDPDNLLPLVYSIESLDSPNWITIDDSTGSLTVEIEGGGEVDCDAPVHYLTYINYTVTAFDGDFNTSIVINIYINDINDNPPRLDGHKIWIDEDNGTTTESQNDKTTIHTMKPKDDDRDEPFRTVKCSFQADTNANVTSRFKIEDNQIKVDLPEGTQLDREKTPDFNFNVACIDDPNRVGDRTNRLDYINFEIILNDLNDNYPVITSDNIKFVENTEVGKTMDITVKDDDLGDNGTVNYFNITEIQRFVKPDHTGKMEGSYDNLFTIKPDESGKNGILQIADSLKGNYGYFLLFIETQDKGTPPLTIPNELNIVVSKFNFKQPEFIFPKDGSSYYLRPQQSSNSQLVLHSGDLFEVLEATDNQDHKYNIEFSIVNDDSNLFDIANLANSQAHLQITKTAFDDKKIYPIGIMAKIVNEDIQSTDEAPYSINCTINIGFFDANTDPVFDYHSDTYEIEENDDTVTIPLKEGAKYPNITLDLPIYYLLNPGSDIFEVDIDTGTLGLQMELDYEKETNYSVTIQSSNSQSLKQNVSPDTKLVVTIQVIDVNDNPPIFDQEYYFAPIIAGALGNSDVVQVTATDIDTTSQGKLVYSIVDVETISRCETDKYFSVDKYGMIKLQFIVEDKMKDCYFILTVKCEDEDLFYDTTTVKIFTVTSENTVNFRFENSLENVKSKKKDIEDLLYVAFGYNCSMEEAKSDASANENDGPVSVAPIYFVNGSDAVVEAVKGAEILKLLTNSTVFTQLRTEFSDTLGLNLGWFTSQDSTDENLQEMLKAWLIGVSVVLGALCLCLLVAFILKTRALNQKIKSLSTPKFGSQESGLNRLGVAAPTTNKHAIEGSNPVYNNDVETKDFDRRSVTSGDSELIGVEDDDRFSYGSGDKKDVIH